MHGEFERRAGRANGVLRVLVAQRVHIGGVDADERVSGLQARALRRTAAIHLATIKINILYKIQSFLYYTRNRDVPLSYRYKYDKRAHVPLPIDPTLYGLAGSEDLTRV